MFDKSFRIVSLVIGFIAFCVLSDSILTTRAAAGEDITISTNTTWEAGTYTYQDITVTNNAVLTLNGSYTNDSDGVGVIINARNITIDSGASITATGKGYATGTGPGKGTVGGMFGSGGSYGGKGGASTTGVASGPIYGLVTNPSHLGSGGTGTSASGGGAITLNLSGNLTAEGNITANGINGGSYTGGGSGGTIKINTIDISGGGTINANGGNGGTSGGGGGGGGRVAIYYTGTKSKENSKFTANAGTGNLAGALGTVFVYDKTNKDSTIFSTITLDPNEGIDENGSPSTDGAYNFRNLTVNNNANLYNRIKYTGDTDGTGIELKLTGDLTIASGSKIDGVGLGYPIGIGEGKPTGSANTYGGGGAHGGNGGRGESGVGGTKYDSTLFPVKPGSGGYTTRGGAGGGAIKITAVNVIIDGSLDQSASAGTLSGSTQGSGAAGGSVYMVASSLTGTGTVKADGSNAVGSSGGGGGGRIAIYADTSSFTANNITAAKGLKGGGGSSADGEVGTVFLYDTASGNVTASSDVTFYANQGVGRDGSARSDGVFYFNNLTVTNNSTVTIAGTYTNDSDGRGVTINLDGNLTIDSGSEIITNGQGFGGGFGPGKGTGGDSTSGSGGSYGGVGGQSYNNNLAPAAYGSTEANHPYKLGSSGGAGEQITGASGGGAITLRVLGNIVNNGVISADGSAARASAVPGWFTGGGSGGSVFLVCDEMSGSGIVTAKGGDGGGTDFGSGGGGGGRISVVYSTAQSLPLSNFSAAGGTGGGGVANRNGSEGSVNITQRILPAAEFTLKNPNNDSTEFTNTENVEIVPSDENAQKYKEAASVSELVPTFYADGWANVADGKNLPSTEGTKTVRAWLKDGNELISSSIGSATITLDKTLPELEITNNNESTKNETATIQMTLSDNLSGIDYIKVKGVRVEISALEAKSIAKASSIKTYADETNFETSVDLAVGENEIPIVLYDKAGNSTEATFVVTRNEVVPSPTPTPSPTDSTTSTTPATAATATTGNSPGDIALNSNSDEAQSTESASPSSAEQNSSSQGFSESLSNSEKESIKDPSAQTDSLSTLKILSIVLGALIVSTIAYSIRTKHLRKKKI